MTRFANNFKTALLMGAMFALFLLIGSFYGKAGLIFALLFGTVSNFIAYFFSDKIAVASMGGVEVFGDTPGPGGRLYHMVDELRQNAGLPMPRVYICPVQAPNAFATGRSPGKAAVCITEGALRLLSESEVRGVMGHELAHVRNRDTLTSCVSAMIAGVLSFFAHSAMWGGFGSRDRREGGNPLAIIAIVLAPIAAVLIQAMISRSREYVADADGSAFAGSPDGLISALQRLEAASQRVPMPNHNPAMNNMFIVEPFLGGLTRIFATHPPMEKRIAALQRLRAEMAGQALSSGNAMRV
ncbi:MAG: M48 family metalloprotease [Phycisphaerales bacterium]